MGRSRALRVLFVVLGVALAGLGVLVGSVPNGAEPDGLFIDCGPAVFGRWPSVDPSCYESFEMPRVGSPGLLAGGFVLVLAGLVRVRAVR